MSTHSSPLPACFRPSVTADDPLPVAAPPPSTDSTNLTTCLYHTHVGLFSLTWSSTLFGRSLHLQHTSAAASAASPLPPHLSLPSSPTSSGGGALSFHLHIKPFLFWKKHGSKRLTPTAQIFWDLSRAKFGSGPEPISGFYIAVVTDGEMALLVGDAVKEAYSKTKSIKPKKSQFMFLRREHLFGTRVYSTTARIGGQAREISVECGVNEAGDGRLWFGIDRRRVLQVKRLKWKFRGNERVEFDGVPINISWDVYNWMFDDSSSSTSSSSRGRHAVFMFRFERPLGEERFEDYNLDGIENFSSFGMNEIELRKMRKSMLRSGRSSSSSSISSSASSGSSVMEWASSEESELCGPIGFSLLVYAWKR